MRSIVAWGIAYAFALASAVLASAYGFLSATGWYAIAKAIILCLVAFGGCHGPAYVVKLRHAYGYGAATLAVLATASCLLVTLWGGLGTIAGGGAELRAERSKAAGDAALDRDGLARLQARRAELGHVRPAAVIGPELATFKASPIYKASGGCDPEQISGPKGRDHCKQYRQLEAELGAAEEATKLDADIALTVARLAAAPPPVELDPQAAAFSALTGLSVELSAALYAFAASVGLELMGMVAMMVAWSDRRAAVHAPSIRGTLRETPIIPQQVVPSIPRRPRLVADNKPVLRLQPEATAAPRQRVFGSVKKFALARVTPAAGERLEVRALLAHYQAWCKESGLPAADVTRFCDEIEAIWQIETDGGRVYALDVCLAA